ncbi:TolC family protein [Ramlibacter tataouinensis]|uniref:TolC family protein n=1 Tax=Ramlibacter tataouinensis TaxID=94132 RepID=UPI0022F3E2B8|nr:TolC family protein [Ramlibacter tataouinensis]WBY01343.1 TolC family protein [Ramlibacter tataouinensis]
MPIPSLRITALAAAALLAGCATVDIDQAVGQTNETAAGFTQGRLELSRTAQQQERRERLAQQLLAEPLGQAEAVQLALANSPALQALVAQGWSDLATAAQGGRIANPVFSFERVRSGSELEIGRLLSFGLLDLLTLPQRASLARNQSAQAQLQLTRDVVDQVSQMRQAWVRAVAAQQQLDYAGQVNRSAQASAELARRMQAAGNFSKLQRARQQAFHADATAQLATAQHAATAAREELVRRLGLSDAQAAQLRLPDRLPELPAQPRTPAEVSAAAVDQRLDVRMARLQLDAAGRSQGLDLLTALVDTEVGIRRDTQFDNADGSRRTARGWEADIRLPLFDWGGARRAAMDAQSLAAAHRHDDTVRAASSQLREGYSAYRTAWDRARHYRDEIVPLRKTISEENVLRYNGMLIGVFELLADHREQVGAVVAAIDAQQAFWLADAALSASLIGQPLAAAPATPLRSAATGEAAAH